MGRTEAELKQDKHQAQADRHRALGTREELKDRDGEFAARRRGALHNRIEHLSSLIRRLTKRIRRKRVRVQPDVVYTKTSPNQSARTTGVSLIVIHSTESSESAGNADLVGIANYFGSSASQASSHVVTDGDGHSARCVADERKAWTQAAFNSPALSVEQIGRAAQTSWPDAQVDETARWIAAWSKKFGIPIGLGAVSGSSVTRKGVVTHAQLGSAGGGHHDPGTHYPMDRLLERARDFRQLI